MIYAESGKFLHPNYKNEQSIDKKITTKPIVCLQKLTRIIALFANDHEIGGKKCHFQHTSAIFLKISDLTPFYQKEMTRFEKNTLKIFKVRRMNVQYSPRKSSTVTL